MTSYSSNYKKNQYQLSIYSDSAYNNNNNNTLKAPYYIKPNWHDNHNNRKLDFENITNTIELPSSYMFLTSLNSLPISMNRHFYSKQNISYNRRLNKQDFQITAYTNNMNNSKNDSHQFIDNLKQKQEIILNTFTISDLSCHFQSWFILINF